MKSDFLTHKGYSGSVSYSAEDNCLFGKIEFIKDLVTYEGETVAQVKVAFVEAVEDYLATCETLGKEPEQPFKGVFQVRTSPEVHRQLAFFAKHSEKNLNELANEAFQQYLNQQKLKQS